MPRSQHLERFVQETEAETYDETVTSSANPLASAYEALLQALAQVAVPQGFEPVVDAGCGTGALLVRLPPHCRPLYGVDGSLQMLETARRKLGRTDAVELVQQDLLELATESAYPVRAVVSSFALHALTDEEKVTFVEAFAARLVEGGVLALGDLMVADGEAPALSPEGAHLWSLETAAAALVAAGLVDVDLQPHGSGVWLATGRKG